MQSSSFSLKFTIAKEDKDQLAFNNMIWYIFAIYNCKVVILMTYLGFYLNLQSKNEKTWVYYMKFDVYCHNSIYINVSMIKTVSHSAAGRVLAECWWQSRQDGMNFWSKRKKKLTNKFKKKITLYTNQNASAFRQY